MNDHEQAAFGVLDAYFEALNNRDSAAMRESFHFPHFRLAGNRAEYFETAEDYGINIFLNRDDTQGWAYTKWDRRNIVHSGPEKVHFDVQFTRYRADHTVLGQYESFWMVTNRAGKWGVAARSSYAG